jgi:hypothetical protein
MVPFNLGYPHFQARHLANVVLTSIDVAGSVREVVDTDGGASSHPCCMSLTRPHRSPPAWPRYFCAGHLTNVVRTSIDVAGRVREVVQLAWGWAPRIPNGQRSGGDITPSSSAPLAPSSASSPRRSRISYLEGNRVQVIRHTPVLARYLERCRGLVGGEQGKEHTWGWSVGAPHLRPHSPISPTIPLLFAVFPVIATVPVIPLLVDPIRPLRRPPHPPSVLRGYTAHVIRRAPLLARSLEGEN